MREQHASEPRLSRVLAVRNGKTALNFYLLGHAHAVLAGLLEAALRPDARTLAAADPDLRPCAWAHCFIWLRRGATAAARRWWRTFYFPVGEMMDMTAGQRDAEICLCPACQATNPLCHRMERAGRGSRC